MKKKVALSDGHGHTTAGKRTPDGYRENYFNEAVVKFLEAELRRCGFDVLQVAPTTADTPLSQRTDAANNWGADIYVAIHYNALSDKWRDGEGGIETYYYPSSVDGKRLAACIHNEVIKGTIFRDRKIKSGNLHEVREPDMPAALLELGFMDIKREAELMKSARYQKECAVETAKGICKYFGMAYIPEKTAIAATTTPTTTEEETNIMDAKFTPTTQTGANAVLTVLGRFERKDPALSAQWREKASSEGLTVHEALELVYVAIERGYISGITTPPES